MNQTIDFHKLVIFRRILIVLSSVFIATVIASLYILYAPEKFKTYCTLKLDRLRPLVYLRGKKLIITLPKAKDINTEVKLINTDRYFLSELKAICESGERFNSVRSDWLRYLLPEERKVMKSIMFTDEDRKILYSLSIKQIKESIRVVKLFGPCVINIEFFGSHPGFNIKMANMLALAYKIKFIKKKIENRRKILSAIKKEVKKEDGHNAAIGELFNSVLSAEIALEQAKEDALYGITLISPAIKNIKVSPRPGYIYNLAVIIGILIGILIVLVWDITHSGYVTPEQIEKISKINILANIPLLHKGRLYKKYSSIRYIGVDFIRWLLRGKLKHSIHRPVKQLICDFKSLNRESEIFKTLRTNLMFELHKHDNQNIISVTSSSVHEGKTFAAFNLAIAFAQAGKDTLFMECDLRKPIIADILNIPERPGITNILQESIDYLSAIRNYTDIFMGGVEQLDNIPNLDSLFVLPAGSRASHPVELLVSDDFENLLSKLKTQFEVIIIDTPPAVFYTDAFVIAKRTSGLLLVYEYHSTPTKLFSYVLQQCGIYNIPLLGIVINKS